MYGLIIDHIVTYIREKYGDAIWIEVKYVSGIEQDHYSMDEVYSEGLPHKLIWATHDVTGESIEIITTNIGYSFYRFLAKYEFHKIVRVLGRSFPEFLNGLDNLHEYLRFSFPKLKPPSFYCEHESRTGLTLHYRSRRRGFLHYVKGQITNISKELFQTDVEIELLDHETDQSMEHVIMRLHFNNVYYSKTNWTFASLTPELRDKIRITSDIFFDIFPFIIVFNRGMRVRNVGIGLLRVMPNLVGKKVNQEFVLMRPFIRLRWEEIMLHSNNIFELMSASSIWDDDEFSTYNKTDPEQMKEERAHMSDKEREKFLVLKGQMFYMEEWESICFMGIPVMQNLSQMYRSGLYINDFALHDSSRDLVLTSTQQQAELRLLMHQEEQKSRNMKENLRLLRKERRRTNRILYKLLPKPISEHLAGGESAVPCCETIEYVTVLFSNIVGFSQLCAALNAIDVISALNEVYTSFDAEIIRAGVTKVETIGDTFLIVSGAPLRTVHHAEYALDCGLALIEVIQGIGEKDEKLKMQIRVGAHSGLITASIIGNKLPKYYIFGETVTIANTMERKAQPMTLLVTESTIDSLDNNSPEVFNYHVHGKFETKTLIYKTFVIDSRKVSKREASTADLLDLDDVADDDEETIHIPQQSVNGRNTPTSLAEDELHLRRRISYTAITDQEIETFNETKTKTAHWTQYLTK